MRRSFLFVAVVSTLLMLTDGQDCSSFRNCDTCIAAGINCLWCREVNNTRCFERGTTVSCSSVEDPVEAPVATQNSAFGAGIQIRPQAHRVQIRPGETKSIDFTFQPGSGFALDLYFLIDLGETMADDFANFRNNIGTMVNAVNNSVTSNLRIGLGTFVDKPVEAFVGNTEFLGVGATPCLTGRTCYYPHSFVHQIDLVDASNFESTFSMTLPFTTRKDNTPGIEGSSSFKANPLNSGLDAITQAARCTEQIGWRDSSSTRRVIVYVSDSGFHLSSESWIAGIVRRQDGMCHLTPQEAPPDLLPLTNNRRILATNVAFMGRLSDYDAAITQEYASSSLVQNVLESNRIVPIFLIESGQRALYQNLVQTLSQSNAVLFDLNGDSSNLVDGSLLVQSLNEVRGNVRLSPEVVDGVTVSISASCGTPAEPNFCQNVVISQQYTFQVNVTVESCTDELRRSVLLPISDPFLGSTVLNISAICECPCSQSRMENSPNCNNRGALSCGSCDCNQNSYGASCQCEGERPSSCPTVNGVECSGFGTCDECNQCMCRDGRYGDSCQCSNTTCSRGGANSTLCSGNGNCVCHECQCAPGYTNDACDCTTNTSGCIDPISQSGEILCSDRGTCECGVCQCGTGYTGTFCKFCTSTTAQGCSNPCEAYHTCVRCRYSLNDNFQFIVRPREDCTAECNGILDAEGNDRSGTRQCTLPLGACDVVFFIPSSSEANNQVLVDNTPQNCAYPFPAWGIALIVFAAAVIIGIILLALLKLILYILDYMEYKRFEDDVNKTTFGENQNPLYRDPQTEHKNPLFRGSTAGVQVPQNPEKPPLEKC